MGYKLALGGSKQYKVPFRVAHRHLPRESREALLHIRVVRREPNPTVSVSPTDVSVPTDPNYVPIVPTEEEVREASRTEKQRISLLTWYKRLNELNQYGIRHGNVDIPQKYPSNPQLGIWSNKQRMEKKFYDDGMRSSMTPARIRALESINFTWAKRKGEHSWLQKYNELLEYKKEFGHVDVPTKYVENKALGRWVSTQRAQYKFLQAGKKSQLTEERLRKLKVVGFVFDLMSSTSQVEPRLPSACHRDSNEGVRINQAMSHDSERGSESELVERNDQVGI